MSTKVLPRDFTSFEMDLGEEMIFHPMTGMPMSMIERLPMSLILPDGMVASPINPAHWFFVRRAGMPTPLSRIGNGKDFSAGSPYPDHWRYDPFTGQELV